MLIAHQRVRREEMAKAFPRIGAPTLDGYSIATITRAEATPIIETYEYLRTVGKATIFIGLVSPARRIEGVVCFGHGPTGYIRELIGEPALCLERGACVHYAPPNAASFLITSACKLVHRITGDPDDPDNPPTSRFFAYADPMAGEYGAVYQASNWLYLGQGLDGNKGRKTRYFVLPPGVADEPQNWQTTRILRRQDPPLTFRAAKAKKWRIESRDAKHVYAINIGKDRKRWRKDLLLKQEKVHGDRLPYPAPRPELKRSFQRETSGLFRKFSFEQGQNQA